MIIIKIKTWKDYKNDFIEWAKAARRKTCKEYVSYMESLSRQAVGSAIEETCKKFSNLTEEQIECIIVEVNRCIYECKQATCKLINDCQPNKLF